MGQKREKTREIICVFISLLLAWTMVAGAFPGTGASVCAAENRQKQQEDHKITTIKETHAILEGVNTSRNLATGEDGSIHIVYKNTETDRIEYVKSTDAGESFTDPVEVAKGNECEVAVSSNGRIFVAYVAVDEEDQWDPYIAYSDDGRSFHSVRLGEESYSNSVHIAVDGDHVYAVTNTGEYFYYSLNNGQSYEEPDQKLNYKNADVLVDPSNHKVIVIKDKPEVYCSYSSDCGKTFSEDQPVMHNGAQIKVDYSTCTAGSGCLYMSGRGAGLYRIDYEQAAAEMSDIDATKNRSLSADRKGNVIAGVEDGGKVYFQLSTDGGLGFADKVEIAEASCANAAINTATGDVLFLYADSSEKLMLYIKKGVLFADEKNADSSSESTDASETSEAVRRSEASGILSRPGTPEIQKSAGPAGPVPQAKSPASDAQEKASVDKKEAALHINSDLKAGQTGSKITLRWGRVPGASVYKVYGQYCGRRYKLQQTVKGTGRTKITLRKLNGKKLDLKKIYKFYIAAYQNVNGKLVRTGRSLDIHIAGRKNTKATNVRAIRLSGLPGKGKSFTIRTGRSVRIKPGLVLANSKKKALSKEHGARFRYASSDESVATVSRSGKITARKAGNCAIYVYAINGCTRKVKVRCIGR